MNCEVSMVLDNVEMKRCHVNVLGLGLQRTKITFNEGKEAKWHEKIGPTLVKGIGRSQVG